ncbi:FAD-linked oxidase C-terminal domain-containing protein [Marivirga atlantica]|jgi:glycolate oxidase|uniref:FAD-binding protein n=1 Tax=Marivirga atlantica TaxID=1548457 RepID=A0A937ADH4_9BACT|nr:FAD-linked oxidase C-terminal domain-containing protein [Marivirga atlantica]MBL0763644.1 FAD-binding protein [Marivirga atlantica]
METIANQSIFEELIGIVGKENAFTLDEDKFKYSHDETEDYSFMPDLVVKPATPEEVSAVMKKCNEHLIPVTPRGGGTGLSGGALPTEKGVVISMERFNRIIEIDELNLQATVEPGVITETFQNAVKEKGLFYPPDPSSKGTCFLGGNLAENSGGPKAVKYGVTRDYVLNMEVVLPTGEIIWTAANVLKNSTGYNLTQLMCGSEGTLGIITKIVFKLRPYPKKDVTLLAPFTSNEEACRAIAAIFKSGVAPSGMEFVEREAIERTQKYLKEEMGENVVVDLPVNIQAHLLMELDGNDDEVLMRDAETILEVLEDFDTGEVLFADNQSRKDELWKLRRNVSPAVNAYSLTKAEDVVVPRGNLPALIVAIKEIGKKYGFNSVCYGHAGDGNLHINIMKEQLSDEYWNNEVNEGIKEIFIKVVELGGTLSGEHGIGIAKRPYMPLAMPEINLELMRGIKKVFDPNSILNPKKIF